MNVLIKQNSLSRALHSSLLLLSATLFGCSDSNDSQSSQTLPTPEPEPVMVIPENLIQSAYILDIDHTAATLGGDILLEFKYNANDTYRADNWFELFWLNDQNTPDAEPFAKLQLNEQGNLSLSSSSIPQGISKFAIYPSNGAGQSSEMTVVRFHDHFGNHQLAGAGGNEVHFWKYGEDKAHLAVKRDGDTCIFENGLVSITDMENEKDLLWESGHFDGSSNQVDDTAFPVYQFDCEQTPFHDLDKIEDEYGVWTYSANNDALYYGTLVYQSLLKTLKEPPLEGPIRIRTHYSNQWRDRAYWDGAYISLSDAYPFYYSSVTLDIIAHETAHGVLGHLTELKPFEVELSQDARTAHEAFADIVGVLVKSQHEFDEDLWVHGASSWGWTRNLSQIKTEYGAVASYIDYEDGGENPYLRIGLLSYPFYQLSQIHSIEETFGLYLSAAKHCWTADMTLMKAASCIVDAAEDHGFAKADVIAAFNSVKMSFDEQTFLGHFTYQAQKGEVIFSDNSQGPNSAQLWYWTFGDGGSSMEQHPTHHYQENGRYTVTLSVTDSTGKTDQFERSIFVDLEE